MVLYCALTWGVLYGSQQPQHAQEHGHMTKIIVRYQVKPDRVDENLRLVEAVFSELKELDVDGFRYAAFQATDGVTLFLWTMASRIRSFKPNRSKRFKRTLTIAATIFQVPCRSMRSGPTGSLIRGQSNRAVRWLDWEVKCR